jgi:hypothetical protein
MRRERQQIDGIAMPMNEQESPQGPIMTDSPWFWVAMFAWMALLALVAVGPKYSFRQQVVERKFLARQEIARRRSGADTTATQLQAELLTAEANVGSGEQFDIDAADNGQGGQSGLIVPLWGLALLVSSVLAVAVVMLLRDRRSAAAAKSAPSASRIHEA